MSEDVNSSSNLSSMVIDNGTSAESESWEHLLIPFEVINLLLLIVTTWVLLSLIVFGTKTNRWRKKVGESSLNSGIVYTCCTIAVACFIPTLIITEVLYHITSIENGVDWCEFVCDAGNLSFFGNLSGAYMFLWLRLRLIYSHPYVRKRVWSNAKYFVIFVFVVLLLVGIAVMCLYVIPGGYQGTSYGCVHRPRVEGKFWQGKQRNILLSILLLFAQSLMMFLAIYAAVKVKYEVPNESDASPSGSRRVSFITTKVNVRPLGGVSIKSPIELAVKRTLISCAVMVASDILSLVPVIFVLPRHAPAELRRTIYNVGSFVNIFCMMATFGFAFRVLTLFCVSFQGSCENAKSTRSNTDKYRAGYESNQSLQNLSAKPE